MKEQQWLIWAKKIQALAQSGLSYTKDKYELERYQQIRDLSVEIMAEYTDVEIEKVRELFCLDNGYATPKVDVRGAVFKDGKVLLVRESIDNHWSMPGGWADIGISIRENVIKEILEEAGMIAEAGRLVGVFDWVSNVEVPIPYAIYKVVMLCEIKGGRFEKNIETTDADFFDLDALPPLSIARNTEALIHTAYEAYCNPDFVPLVD